MWTSENIWDFGDLNKKRKIKRAAYVSWPI